MAVAEREWKETDSGLVFPGPSFGVAGPIRPSPGGYRLEAVLDRYIRQSKGRWRGKPIKRYPEQRGFLHELLRTRAGRRIYRRALYGIARKNGKSTLAAAIALYLLLFDDEPAPEVYSLSGDRAQARIVFGEASRMVRQSEALSEWCRVLKNEIVVDAIDGVYRAISADAGLAHGSNPSGGVADELHVLPPDGELWYAVETGMDAREAPLLLGLTTAGWRPDSFERQLFELGLSGEDPEFLLWWHGAAEGADYDDPTVWQEANPAPWITAKRIQSRRGRLPAAVFARLHLNLWTDSEEMWVPPGTWERGSVGHVDLAGARTWTFVDIGIRHDTSAIVEVAKVYDDDGKVRLRAKAHILDPASRGGVVDLAALENKLLELNETRDMAVVQFDEGLYMFARSAEDLSDRLPMEGVPPSNARTVPASQLLYDLIVEQRIEHDGDEEFARHVKAAVVRETERGWRISKSKSKRPIDACFALAMAAAAALEDEGSGVGVGGSRIF